MLRIGCHLSCAAGYLAMARDAVAINADTFQFFTRNPRGGRAKPLSEPDLRAFLGYAEEHGIGSVLAHAPYTLNPCSNDEKIRAFAREVMADDLAITDRIPGCMYNFHPGSHVKQGAEEGIRMTAEHLNAILKPDLKTPVLIETMAGKGSEIGRTFGEIRDIMDRVELTGKLGVCLDTCHVWDGGYDIVNRLDDVLGEFDRIVGLGRLKAVHLNDSKNPLGSHKDRHERVGHGQIGLEALVGVINHASLRGLPFYLETPQDSLGGWADEIALLRGFYTGD